MNHRLQVIVFVIYSLIVAAVLTRNGNLLLMALPFLMYLGMAILQLPGEVRLQASRTFNNANPNVPTPVEVKVTLENAGSETVYLHLSDSARPDLQIMSGYLDERLALPAREETSINYSFQPQRGEYIWDTVQVCVSDPLGLIEQPCQIPAPGKVFTYPEAKKFKHIPLKPEPMLQAAGPFLSRSGGAGIDFFGVREFRPGDPINQIHWRLTARHPQSLFTKELEREEIADIGLILDARTITELSNGKELLFEHSIRATASLAKVFLREGNRVGMLIFGSGLTCVFPGSGKRQLQKILQNLARAKIGSNASLNLFSYLPVRMFPSHSSIVVISPVGMRDLQAFRRLKAFGYQVLLISPNPVSYGLESERDDRAYLLAARAAHVERQIQLSNLEQLGVEVIDWQVDQPLPTIIHTALRKRKVSW